MSVQDILMQQALEANQNQPDPGAAMAVGGIGGALLGAAAGAPLNATGQFMNRMFGRSPRGLRPGFRMAGGLAGAIAGGALGAGLANTMRTANPAGEMLATLQSQGGKISGMQRMQLQQLLADAYSNMGV